MLESLNLTVLEFEVDADSCNVAVLEKLEKAVSELGQKDSLADEAVADNVNLAKKSIASYLFSLSKVLLFFYNTGIDEDISGKIDVRVNWSFRINIRAMKTKDSVKIEENDENLPGLMTYWLRNWIIMGFH